MRPAAAANENGSRRTGVMRLAPRHHCVVRLKRNNRCSLNNAINPQYTKRAHENTYSDIQRDAQRDAHTHAHRKHAHSETYSETYSEHAQQRARTDMVHIS